MAQEVRTLNYGGVNCYLVTSGKGYILIDAGLPNQRAALERELAGAGCKPGDLTLIILTHGDYDHAGNAAYLGRKYGAPIAMHPDDVGRVERGDWDWGLKAKPDRFAFPFRIVSLFVRPGPFDTFKPDLYAQDGQSLSTYGCDAQVLYLPGHTRGSLGILTTGGDLFCGDLLANLGRPDLQFYINDLSAAKASIARLEQLRIGTVYPGHGKSFPMERFANSRR